MYNVCHFTQIYTQIIMQMWSVAIYVGWNDGWFLLMIFLEERRMSEMGALVLHFSQRWISKDNICIKDPQFWSVTHLKRPWCWERLRTGGEGDDRGWDGWMASPTRRTWVWVNSRSWWWTGRPGMLRFVGLQSRTPLSDWTDTELRNPRVDILSWVPWSSHLESLCSTQ